MLKVWGSNPDESTSARGLLSNHPIFSRFWNSCAERGMKPIPRSKHHWSLGTFTCGFALWGSGALPVLHIGTGLIQLLSRIQWKQNPINTSIPLHFHKFKNSIMLFPLEMEKLCVLIGSYSITAHFGRILRIISANQKELPALTCSSKYYSHAQTELVWT